MNPRLPGWMRSKTVTVLIMVIARVELCFTEAGTTMRKFLLLIPVLIASACSMDYQPSYRFNNVQVVNLTGVSIRDVSVNVVGSEKMLACEDVNPNAMCAERFPSRRYPQQGIQLSWAHGDGNRHSETLDPHIATFFNASFPLRIVMEIREDGSVKAFYEQDEPGRAVYF